MSPANPIGDYDHIQSLSETRYYNPYVIVHFQWITEKLP
jgi:hypothetical protein